MFTTFWIVCSVAELIAVAGQTISAGFAEVFVVDGGIGAFGHGDAYSGEESNPTKRLLSSSAAIPVEPLPA